ncbi:MAG: hypothetical protein IKR25_05455 [Muribaculaceae bacterium]|nr:hypothetical protein [Muribaculaceae bacterium]
MKQLKGIVHRVRVAAVCYIVVCCVGLRGFAQVEGMSKVHNVIRLQLQGFNCSYWGGGNCVNIDGVADRNATSLVVPDEFDWNGRVFLTAELGPSAFQDMKHLQRCSFNAWNVLIHAFTGCEALRVIELRRAEPPSVGHHAFYFGTPDEVFDDYHFLTVALVVPPGREQVYREAPGWREFHTIVSHAPRPDDYDLAAIRSRVAALEQECDSLTAFELQLRDSLAMLANGVPDAEHADVAPGSAAVKPAMHTELPPFLGGKSIERLATKFLSDDYVYKSRFSPEVILDSHTDTLALHLAVPDWLEVGGRSYPVAQMWEDAFANHGHLLSLTLPADLTNVAPGAFAGCRELRLLELRNPVPPAFRSIDEGDCLPEQVISDELCARLVLVVPPGSEQTYREAPGWSRCARITSSRPTLAQLGVTPTAERRIAIDAHLCRIAARQAHIATSLKALRNALAG